MEFHISLKPEIIATIAGLPISNSFVLSVLTAFLLLSCGFFAVWQLKRVPGRIQNGTEIVVDGILNFMSQTLGDREQAKKFFPLVATIFLFILVNNWMGLVPGVGSFGAYEETAVGEPAFVPFFRSANSDLNTTVALTLVTMIAIQLYGIRRLGFLGHVSKFFTFTKGPIYFFVGILELIAEFAKVLSFSFRLFGNIFAGEVLLVIVMTLVPLVVPFPFLMLELFVGLVQALVFAMLAMIFAKIATETAH